MSRGAGHVLRRMGHLPRASLLIPCIVDFFVSQS
jgi:hypothetical protein